MMVEQGSSLGDSYAARQVDKCCFGLLSSHLLTLFLFMGLNLDILFFAELLLWLVRHSVWLPPPDILKLLIRRDIEITPFTPIRPQPPAIYLVPRGVVLTSGCNDGYDWDEIKTYTIKVKINVLNNLVL